ncbi:hypothetical protein Nepgr_013871 [Nepenthes gracilis]|uniref:ENTH domain-containing protein n=1 Tax=Nepenthes gracilis TaxID=150966 RepID=A0AAD3XPU5_NEPGR|nr:hypothetical protein Nepgr_013871 [Nepenthes gracilis]
MPSKIRKAIAAVKDHTSISFAKVKTSSQSSNLEVAILKATTHDEGPIDERYVTEVLQCVSSNRTYAAICARAIGRRIGRTRNWVVAVKSLMLVLRVFQDGDPHFPKEVLHAMKRGYKILNLSSFRDDSSTSCPWDFSAFVRTFALYLDERLDCFVTGKLQRRMAYREGLIEPSTKTERKRTDDPTRDMKPAMLLDRISYWQTLLDRAIATRPTGAARTNRLVQTCLYAIVQESFDLYRDISNWLTLLLDSFFHLQYNSCITAFQTCVKASKQFEELRSFYDLCKGIEVGRTSEYPSVQRLSDELVETLQEFLKDQSSFPSANGRTLGSNLLLPAAPPRSSMGGRSSPGRGESQEQVQSDRMDKNSEYGSQCTSLEDLISADAETTPTRSFHGDRCSDATDKRSQHDDFFSMNDDTSVLSGQTNQRNDSRLDLLSLDEGPTAEEEKLGVKESGERPQNLEELKVESRDGWELVLLETVTQSSEAMKNEDGNGFKTDFIDGFSAKSSLSRHHYNPFLQDAAEPATKPIHTSGAAPANVDLFAAFAENSSAPAICASLNYSYGNGNTAGPVDFFADTGNSNANANAALPDDFGNANGQSSFPANFANSNGVINSNCLMGFPYNYTNSIGNGNFNYQAGFPAEFGTGFSVPNDNGNALASLPADFGNKHSSGSGNIQPTFDAAFDISGAASAIVPFGFAFEDSSSSAPAYQTAPTFRATNAERDQPPSLQDENDPFGPFPSIVDAPIDQQSLLQQQQLWFQNQSKIFAKHMAGSM